MYTYGEETFTLEMWTVNNDGTPGDSFTRSYPSVTRNGRNTRRHDALRNLASFALATPNRYGEFDRVPRRFVRVNSVQGVAWDTRNPSRVAYFQN